MTHLRYKLATYLAALVLLTDQLSKWWALDLGLEQGQAREIAPHFNIVLVHNRGVTFGLLNNVDHQWMVIGLIAAAAIIVMMLGRWLYLTTSTTVAIALGAIMGGAVGNIIDRVRYGSVVDFLDFYYDAAHHWPAFNAADSAIVCGVGLLLLDSMVRAK